MVLLAFSDGDNYFPVLSTQQIKDKASVSYSSVTKCLYFLLHTGYLEKVKPTNKDKRLKLYGITEKGLDFLCIVREVHNEIVNFAREHDEELQEEELQSKPLCRDRIRASMSRKHTTVGRKSELEKVLHLSKEQEDS